jgi:pimeloyl-ACP methyl ester carboxylesterase
MGKSLLESGYFIQKYPYLKYGTGTKNLVVFPPTGELRVSLSKDPRGQAKMLSKFLPPDYTLWMLGYDQHLPPNMTNESVADDFAQFIKERVGSAVIVGISYGGTIAIPFAARHPELTEKLVLLITAHRLSDTGLEFCREAVNYAKQTDVLSLDLMFNRLYKRNWLRKLFNLITRLKYKKTLRIQNPLSIFINAYDYLIATNGINTQYLPQIRTPTLLLAGTADIFFTPAILTEAQQKIPNSRLILIDDEHHMVPVERLGLVKYHLLDFLQY